MGSQRSIFDFVGGRALLADLETGRCEEDDPGEELELGMDMVDERLV